jgi:hypothetical protein
MEANQTQKKFSLSDTTATKKVFALRKRIRAIAGGTSASKTISVLIWLIDYCQSHRGKTASVVSESYPHLEKGAMLDFENIMKDRRYWNDDRWNQTKHTYTFETGSRLEFYSPDTTAKRTARAGTFCSSTKPITSITRSPISSSFARAKPFGWTGTRRWSSGFTPKCRAGATILTSSRSPIGTTRR